MDCSELEMQLQLANVRAKVLDVRPRLHEACSWFYEVYREIYRVLQ